MKLLKRIRLIANRAEFKLLKPLFDKTFKALAVKILAQQTVFVESLAPDHAS
jgi:hypothetical protein